MYVCTSFWWTIIIHTYCTSIELLTDYWFTYLLYNWSTDYYYYICTIHVFTPLHMSVSLAEYSPTNILSKSPGTKDNPGTEMLTEYLLANILLKSQTSIICKYLALFLFINLDAFLHNNLIIEGWLYVHTYNDNNFTHTYLIEMYKKILIAVSSESRQPASSNFFSSLTHIL
jgi:hypothetical protein